MTADALARAFAVTGGDPERRAALDRFLSVGFPTPRLERWRYTDLKPIEQAELDFAPAPPDAARLAVVRDLLRERGLPDSEPRLVLVDGHYAESLSTAAAATPLRVSPSAAKRAPSRRSAAQPEEHPLALLNAAFAGGLALTAPRNKTVETPVHLVLAGSGVAGIAAQPRVVIELEAGAKLTLVAHFVDAAAAGYWHNAVIEVVQAERSSLTLYRLQEHDRSAFHTSLLRAELAHDASLTAAYVDLGGRLVRNDVDVALAARGARAEVFGVLLASEGQHVDDHLRIDHLAPETTSEETFRAIVDRKGRGVFNGKVVVHRDAQGVDARQRTDSLLLAEQAEVDTKPELEIYADNVKCSHGATVGELDEEHVFYLRSRGLDEAAARALLTFAFARAVLERVRLPALRELLSDRVRARLPNHEHWENLA
ncbi:MAG TPA: Fe-S cluster assembly protein SufD [Gammaproteobacteria bacterium]